MRNDSKPRPRTLAVGLATCVLLGIGTSVFAQAPSTVTPAPRKGYWMALHQRFLDRAKQGNVDLLFLGDSITQGWNDNEVWKRYYGPRHAANFGIGGDQTPQRLLRNQNGGAQGITPQGVGLMIG